MKYNFYFIFLEKNNTLYQLLLIFQMKMDLYLLVYNHITLHIECINYLIHLVRLVQIFNWYL